MPKNLHEKGHTKDSQVKTSSTNDMYEMCTFKFRHHPLDIKAATQAFPAMVTSRLVSHS